MTQFIVNMYLVCEDAKHFHSDIFFAPTEACAEEKAKKHYLYRNYPFLIASCWKKEIRSVEIIDIKEVEKEVPPKNNLFDDIDYWEDKSMTEEEYIDTLSQADFVKYFC